MRTDVLAYVCGCDRWRPHSLHSNPGTSGTTAVVSWTKTDLASAPAMPVMLAFTRYNLW